MVFVSASGDDATMTTGEVAWSCTGLRAAATGP